jgi:hypothetical protein
MTPFEIAQQQVKEGQLKTPSVSVGTTPIDYFKYQLSVHKFNLSIMASGMKFRGITFTQIKKYYGLKGKSAKDCLPQFILLMNKFLNPVLNQITIDTPNTVIDYVWEEYISPEVLRELMYLTDLKSYAEILAKYEGYTVEEMLNLNIRKK